MCTALHASATPHSAAAVSAAGNSDTPAFIYLFTYWWFQLHHSQLLAQIFLPLHY